MERVRNSAPNNVFINVPVIPLRWRKRRGQLRKYSERMQPETVRAHGTLLTFQSQIQLAPISTNGQFSAGNSAAGTIQVNIGAPTKNA